MVGRARRARTAGCRPTASSITTTRSAFLGWFNQQLLDAPRARARRPIDVDDAQEVPKGITDDFGDKDGSSMRSSADISEDPCNQKLTLQDLVQGFDAPECTP